MVYATGIASVATCCASLECSTVNNVILAFLSFTITLHSSLKKSIGDTNSQKLDTSIHLPLSNHPTTYHSCLSSNLQTNHGSHLEYCARSLLLYQWRNGKIGRCLLLQPFIGRVNQALSQEVLTSLDKDLESCLHSSKMDWQVGGKFCSLVVCSFT